MFSLFYAWTNDWANNQDADLRRHGFHYDVTDEIGWVPKYTSSLPTQVKWYVPLEANSEHIKTQDDARVGNYQV